MNRRTTRHSLMTSGLALVGLTLALEGCALPDASIDDDPTGQLEHDFGGPSGLMEFFSGSDEAAIEDMLSAYDMGYVEHVVVEDRADYIGDCPKYFPSSDRNTWHAFNGEYYYIDSSGRPYKAYAYLPPIVAEARSTSCQGNVGGWGDAENPSNDYDGGHMIGSQLGGWGKRANMVPQDSNFNRGNWVALENQMALCDRLPNQRMFYYVRADYSNSTKLVPSKMHMMLEDRSTGVDVWLAFDNQDYGGPNGTSERKRGVDFLKAHGCY